MAVCCSSKRVYFLPRPVWKYLNRVQIILDPDETPSYSVPRLSPKGRGGAGLRSVRNLCLFQFADAMVLLIVGITAVNVHGSVNKGVPVYFAGAFIALPLLAAIAALAFVVYLRSKKCNSKPEAAQKIGVLMKAYSICLWLSWPGWFVAMMLTGITGICRNSGCSYSIRHTGNFSLAIIILVCIGLAFFANVLCTMLLYVYCSDMGLTIYGTKRIKVGDALSQSGSPRFTPVTATTESQTVSAVRKTATAQCQTHAVFNVHESAFKPIQSAHNPRPAIQDNTSSPVWAIPSGNTPPVVKQTSKTPKKRAKKSDKKKKHKENKYKHSDKSSLPDSALPSLDSSVVYSTSAVHIDSFGSVEHPLASVSPLHNRSYRHTPLSPPQVHSPDYLHVQLPNAPLSADQDPTVSYQVSYLPFTGTQRSSPPTNTHPIRIPTATPPEELSPPPTPSFRTNAWQTSPVSSTSSSPVRCMSPQPPSSFSSTSPPSFLGDPFLPTLQSRYNPTPPPMILSPRGRGMLFTDAYEDGETPPFTP